MTNEVTTETHPMMPFGRAIKTCFGKYADFSGRASRAEYWWFALFLLLMAVGVSWIECQVLGKCDGVLGWLLTLATLLPNLAVGARRLHDIGRSGWWLLLWIPGWLPLLTVQFGGVIGELFLLDILGLLFVFTGLLFAGLLFMLPLLIMACFRTKPETNKYGDPA